MTLLSMFNLITKKKYFFVFFYYSKYYETRLIIIYKQAKKYNTLYINHIKYPFII